MTAREKLFRYKKIYDQVGSESVFLEAMKESVEHHRCHCVFYAKLLDDRGFSVAEKLARKLEKVGSDYPSNIVPLQAQAQITWTQELIKMEQILMEKSLIQRKEYSVMIDYQTQLKGSPLYRNIWVMPIERQNLFKILWEHKGNLQTVGLSCLDSELEELSKIFYAAGIHRIMPCGQMSSNYSGEPHDGSYTLGRYVRKVNRRLS